MTLLTVLRYDSTVEQIIDVARVCCDIYEKSNRFYGESGSFSQIVKKNVWYAVASIT